MELFKTNYLQYKINEFLLHDIDIISWKYVCKNNFYYNHNIIIKKFIIQPNFLIFPYLKIIEINTEFFTILKNSTDYLYINKNIKYNDNYHYYDFVEETDKSIITMNYLNSPISFSFFDSNNLKYSALTLKKLVIYDEYFKLNDKTIKVLKNLEYLDVGLNSELFNFYLPKLTTLLLRDNYNINIDTILSHRNLVNLQLCKVYNNTNSFYYGINHDDYSYLKYIKNIKCNIYNILVENSIFIYSTKIF